ncbi:MAG: transposase [Clostridia bacterium]|nr:transposase [Clostridia bacterium]
MAQQKTPRHAKSRDGALFCGSILNIGVRRKEGHEGRERFHEFGLFAAAVDLPEFEPMMRVLRNWSKYILNSFDCGYTNGFTEGCNNKIKVIKRIAFGYRSFHNLRQRILLTNDPPRNAANPTPRGA